MPCCPSSETGEGPVYEGYTWNEKGSVDRVGTMNVYRVGTSHKCIIWCYDIYGFKGGRTRELCDKLADKGYMVLLPDFFRGEWRDVGAGDLDEWIRKQSDWSGHRQIEWVEELLPYARSVGAEIFGAVGTCWGASLVTRLCSYGEFKAGASMHPATTAIIQTILNQDLYEILEEVQCPQLLITAGDDDKNEMKGGLAEKVWSVMKFGDACDYKTYPDMVHGWTVRGDVRDPRVENAARAAFNAVVGFLAANIK